MKMNTVYFIMYWEGGKIRTVQTNSKRAFESYAEYPLDSKVDLVVVKRNGFYLLHQDTPFDYKSQPKTLHDCYIIDRGIMDIPEDAGK